ncbi:YcfL family protein [Helicobacter winghamensis]|uniref:YcfL family protein n=1 Tax=Helicobacter winghamensis TaxID=157268 RepID=UPI0027A556E5
MLSRFVVRILLPIFGILVFFGCAQSAQHAILKKKYQNYVYATDFDTSQISAFSIRENPTSGLIEFFLEISPTSTKQLLYKLEWLDKDDFSLNNIQDDFKMIQLNDGYVIKIKHSANHKKAKSVKIYLKGN